MEFWKKQRLASCFAWHEDELISIHPEIRLLFYFGVLLTAAGVGLLVKQNYHQIGPLAIAIGVGIGALASFAWAARRAPAFLGRDAIAFPELRLSAPAGRPACCCRSGFYRGTIHASRSKLALAPADYFPSDAMHSHPLRFAHHLLIDLIHLCRLARVVRLIDRKADLARHR